LVTQGHLLHGLQHNVAVSALLCTSSVSWKWLKGKAIPVTDREGP
jgi:hypothetical protein